MHPDNLLIAESGVIKLGDFGLTTPLEHSCSLRDTGHVASRYMAPEVREGKAELKSDVWSLGISLFEMEEGKSALDGCITNDALPSLSSSNHPPAFVDFVSKCMVKEVKEVGVFYVAHYQRRNSRFLHSKEVWLCLTPNNPLKGYLFNRNKHNSRTRSNNHNKAHGSWHPYQQ